MWRRVASLVLAFFYLVGPASAAPDPQSALKVPLATQVVFLGLALAGERVVAVGERGVVIYSDDAGATWSQADVPVRGTLTALTFVDQTTGFAVGHDDVILKTIDAGATWSLLNFEPESQKMLLNVRFRDSQTGWVMGTDGQLWITRDGGSRWERLTLAVEGWYQNHIFDVTWLPDGTTLVVAEKGVLYRSADGLGEFKPIGSPYEGSYFGALTLAGGRMLIYGMNGHAFVSDDAGDSWQPVKTGTRQFLLNAAPLDDGRTLLVGSGGTVLALDPRTLAMQATQLPERVGITAVLSRGEHLYVATEAGRVQKKPLAGIFK